jgi:hypothetical protein
MTYNVPGNADVVSEELVGKWNEVIQEAHRALTPQWATRFFSLDPAELEHAGPATVKWFADPAEPNFCIDADTAQTLCDWGVRGRQALHNEYCEYHTVYRPDATGRMRPKRVQVTTELREYWVCLAMHEPDAVRAAARSVLGFEPGWEDLYGASDPSALSADQRKVAFSRQVAGHGNDDSLIQAEVPAQPVGPLNTQHALFMTHPINGLDDLLYIVMFGAKPYARRAPGGLEPATREQVFRQFRVEHLACRHADPAAATAAHAAAFGGRPVAFADPLGVYIRAFADYLFQYHDGPLPESWLRWSRGQAGLYQRLEFGPGDDDAAFLDDIRLVRGEASEPVTGGYQVVQQMEVGPLVVAGSATAIAEGKYVVLSTSSADIRCHEAGICTSIRRLRDEYQAAQPLVRVAPRTMGRREG